MNLPILSLPIENACGCVDTESGKSNECMCPATGLVQTRAGVGGFQAISESSTSADRHLGNVAGVLGVK
ncbi:MAG: hypothetical protein M3367_05550 [Acidobacteriota bacterium]|nr:hypothetical protein [Acidobacteriota bacterium]